MLRQINGNAAANKYQERDAIESFPDRGQIFGCYGIPHFDFGDIQHFLNTVWKDAEMVRRRNKSFPDCRWSCYDSWCPFTLLVVSREENNFKAEDASGVKEGAGDLEEIADDVEEDASNVAKDDSGG